MMDRKRAMRLAERWADGGVCTLREGEAKEYHAMCLAALREQEQRGWISVKDRLPNREDADPKGFIIAIDKESNKSKIWWFDIVAKYPQEFTHWMPLPEPPKED